MDVQRTVIRILSEARRRHLDGSLDAAAMARIAARANALRGRDRRRKLAASGRGVPYVIRAAEGLLRLRAAIAAGARIVAIDLAYPPTSGYVPGAFEEVGIATWRDGAVEALTVADAAAIHRHPDPALRVMRHPDQPFRPSLYGPALAMSHGEAWGMALEAYRSADVAVFHSCHADLPRLGLALDPEKVVDTEICGWAWFGRRPSLSDLCAGLGIECLGPHNSGNDARHTLAAALALASEPGADLVVERARLRTEWDDATRRLVEHPTRAPGRDALGIAAGAAHRRYMECALPRLPRPADSPAAA